MNASTMFRAESPSGSTIKSAVVAGGAGFLGSHLCQRLVDLGWFVYCLDNFRTGRPLNVEHLVATNRFRLLEHDVCEPLPAGLKVSAVFNLACPASPPRYQADPIHTLMTSVVGTRHLLELASREGARFLQASTSEVYGDPEQHPQREDYWGHVNPTGPRACYDEGKRAAETLCFDYQRLGLAEVRVARIFNTYGPRMLAEDGRIVSNLICQALAGRPLTIYGNGEQTRSFCYVTDLVDGLLALMGHDEPPPSPVNLGNPGEFTINALARLVLQLTRSGSSVQYRPIPRDDPQRRRPDITLARTLLDWSPKVPLAAGLKPTIAWFGRSGERARAGSGRDMTLSFS